MVAHMQPTAPAPQPHSSCKVNPINASTTSCPLSTRRLTQPHDQELCTTRTRPDLARARAIQRPAPPGPAPMQSMVPMRQKWSKLVLGGLLFGLLMFQPVAEGSAAAAVGLTAKAATGADRRDDTVHHQIDMSQLAALDIDPGLKQFLGEMVAGFQVQVHRLKKGEEAFEMKTQSIETMLMKESQEKLVLREENRALKTRLTHLESVVVQLTNKSATQSRHLTTEVENIAVRLDQCKEETLSFVTEMERRRMQDVDTCQGSGLSEMFTACCPNHGGHRRSLQDHGCDTLPETCPGTCAPLFIDFFEGCREMINSLTPAEQQEFAGFYADCTEMAQQQAAISDGAKPALMFHMVVIDQEAEQQEAAMLNPGSALGPPPTLGPVQLPPPVDPHTPPPPTTQPNSGAVQEFQRVCSRANLTVCAPRCNLVTEGYLLSVLIEGRGTLMTCNQEQGFYSWQGQSALGSCITRRGATWLENIMTHAAGTFALELSASTSVVIAADLVAGQSALLHGIVEGGTPVWTFLGEGPAFIVGAAAELEISALTVAATTGLAFRIAGTSTITVASLQLQKGDGSADAISCAALATGVGQAGLTCVDTGFGGVDVAGPLFISTSGAGFGMGATQYMGSDRGVFEEAVSTEDPGLYTCQISHDETVALALPVESAMHVSIVGDDSMPRWRFTGEGLAFTVAVHAYLNLAYVTVPGGQVSLMRGGEVSLDHVQMQGTQIHVAGSLAASNSQLTDVQFETEASAVMTIDSTTISGTGEEALALSIGCSATINGGEIRNGELQVASDGELIVTGTTIHVEGMAVSVAAGGSFTVSTSQLVHGEVTDPFPCNGANMACTAPHAGSVAVAGPASVITAAPLVCTDESAGSCLSGYVDMPSCLAGIAQGFSRCFVCLQRDTGDLGTISVDDGEHFEIHGNQREPKLRILADFGVSGVLVLVDLAAIGGSGDGSQISVEVGGQLRFDRVQMAGGSVTFAGVVSLVESSLAEVAVTGSSGSELGVSGGTLTGSTVTTISGQMALDAGCVLTDSPISVRGARGVATVSRSELQSDGSSTPLAVESGGSATVAQTSFRSTAGNITAVSVAEGGSLIVGGSRLIRADGGVAPLPCDGTLPRCVGAHEGSVAVDGPSVIAIGVAPLVCDVGTGVCLSDLCVARFGADPCANGGRCDYAAGTCACAEGWFGDTCDLTCDQDGLTDAQALLGWRAGLSVVPDGCPVAQWGGGDACGWEGVDCGDCEDPSTMNVQWCRSAWSDAEHGRRVTALYPSGQYFPACGQIVGTLSPCMAKLEYLRALYLPMIPGLSGPVPAELIDGLPHLDHQMHLWRTAVDGPSCQRLCDSHPQLSSDPRFNARRCP